jgi:hypothetical protein
MTSAFVNRIQTVQAQLSLAEQAVSAPLDGQIRLSRRATRYRPASRRQKIVSPRSPTTTAGRAHDAPPIWELCDRAA